MKIIIIGGGVVGYSLAEELLADKHTLSLIESDPNLCQQISEKLDLQIINGSGTSSAALKEAGIESADMVLAVTPINEVNLLVCAIAAQHSARYRIARLRGRDFVDTGSIFDLKKFGVTTVIHPERALVDQVLQYVQSPHAVDSANFENGRILMRGHYISENMEIVGKTPRQIRSEISPYIILFSAIVRQGIGMIPDGDTRIETGDLLYSLFPKESLDRYLRLVGIEVKNRKIIMTGGSLSTSELAQALDKTEYHVTYVDPNLAHAEQVASLVDKVEVIHGDCTQIELLQELNVDKASFFLAVSDETDYNMLSALLAKAEGAHEVISTATESHHDRLFRSIGIDHVINPRLTTAREILDTVARGHIGAKVKLTNVDIEAVRFIVTADSDISGMKVKEIATKLKKGSIIGIIVREEKLIIPEGETEIKTGDHVIVITHQKNLAYVSKLFKPNRLFGRS